MEIKELEKKQPKLSAGNDGARNIANSENKKFPIKSVLHNNKDYPKQLLQLKNPPEKLYYTGDLSILNQQHNKTIAIVGSRRATQYGKKITEELVKKAFRYNFNIVSGLAFGIDIAAHKAVLKLRENNYSSDNGCNELSTFPKAIIVLPSGLNKIHPESHKRIFNLLVENGNLAISQFEPDHPAFKWTYHSRNRLIAALSEATIVVEAQKEGGSLNTAKHVKELKKPLFAVPGPINSDLSTGCNQLIKNGAQILTQFEDILSNLQIELPFLEKDKEHNSSQYRFNPNLSPTENKVVEQLFYSAKGGDELSRAVGLSISNLNSTLSILQLKGILIKKEELYYVN